MYVCMYNFFIRVLRVRTLQKFKTAVCSRVFNVAALHESFISVQGTYPFCASILLLLLLRIMFSVGFAYASDILGYYNTHWCTTTSGNARALKTFKKSVSLIKERREYYYARNRLSRRRHGQLLSKL